MRIVLLLLLSVISTSNVYAFEKMFDLNLSVQSDQEQVFSNIILPNAKYIASGNGTISGNNLSGDVVWDFYEIVGPEHCQSDLFGKIITDDGNEFTFHARGALMTDPNDPKIWNNISSIIFKDLPTNYAYLEKINGILKGKHNLYNYTMRHEVFN